MSQNLIQLNLSDEDYAAVDAALVTLEAGLQLLVACVLFGLPAWPSLSVIAGVLVGAGWWSEAVVRKQYIQSITPCRRATDVPSPSMGQGNS